MVKVECDGCKAPYQIDEKRIPPNGLKMRCPKCGTNLVVMKPADTGAAPEADLPAKAGSPPAKAAPPRPPPPKGPPPAPKPAGAPPALPAAKAAPPKPPPPPRIVAKPAPIEDELSGSDIESDWGEDDESNLPEAAKNQPGLGGMRGRAEPPPVSMGGFGEIDLMVDLPAPSIEGSDFSADLPVAAPPVRGIKPRHATQVEGFGTVDLPAISASPSDLPAVRPGQPTYGAPPARAPRTQLSPGFGEVDLPSFDEPASPGPLSDPRPRARSASFGEIDLPSVGEEVGLPASKPFAHRMESSFGEIDLPLVSGDSGLPTPVSTEGLPVVGGYGLPSPAIGYGLPVAAGTGLPVAAGTGLPVAAGTGLPVAAGSGLPMPAPVGFPVISGGGLPVTAMSTGLPVTSGSGLPVSAMATGLPMTSDAFSSEADLFGADDDDDAPPRPRSKAMDVGDELPLGDERGRSNAFDDSDRAMGLQETDLGGSGIGLDTSAMELDRAAVGGEAEIGGSGEPGQDDALHPSQAADRPRRGGDEAQSKKGNARKVALAAVVLLALGGGALALEPSIGPFGVNFIRDQINAKDYAARLDELRTQVQADLDEDTSVAAGRALTKARATQASIPRYRAAAAYCAYVALARGIRFGHRTDD
ncbi:MAG: zinc-ribbon domain-containing protein, partial [Minicystis sp.]